MMYGGSLSARRIGPRDDVAGEVLGTSLDQRLPTSTRGSAVLATERLAAFGVLPGRYSGVEQAFTDAGAMSAALEPSLCEIRNDGALVVTGQSTQGVTTFGWALDRWRWSPHAGVIVEAIPRRLGGVTIIDFVACEGTSKRPAGRFYLNLTP